MLKIYEALNKNIAVKLVIENVLKIKSKFGN